MATLDPGKTLHDVHGNFFVNLLLLVDSFSRPINTILYIGPMIFRYCGNGRNSGINTELHIANGNVISTSKSTYFLFFFINFNPHFVAATLTVLFAAYAVCTCDRSICPFWKSITMTWFSLTIFNPPPLRLWGIVITWGGRAVWRSGGRASGQGGGRVRNSALTKKLTDKLSLFFHRHDLCAWAIHPIYFFWHQAISCHFLKWVPEKLVGTITYEP